MALCQVGEFAFVLLGLTAQFHVLDGEIVRLLVASVALSMVATPPLLILLEKVILPRFTKTAPKRGRGPYRTGRRLGHHRRIRTHGKHDQPNAGSKRHSHHGAGS